MGVRLPSEYQEVEYLEATGTQAFFTDIPIQDGLTVDSIQTFDGGDYYLFGGYNEVGLQNCFNGYYASSIQTAYAGYYTWALNRISPNNTTIYHVVSTQRNGYQSGYLDGELILNGARTTTLDTSGSALAVAFGQRNASGTINQWYKGKVYSFKVSKDGVQLADYVPCYRKSDNKPGMYDTVLHKFYVNELTGEFLVGPDVIDSISPLMVAWRRMLMRKPARLPAEFQEVQYIEATGTQYIVTNYYPVVEALSIELDYMFTTNQDGDQYIFYATGSGPIVSAEYYDNSRWYVYSGLVAFANVLRGVGGSQNVNHRFVADSQNETLTIDGTTAGKTGNRNNGPLGYLTLFAISNGVNSSKGLRIYSLIFKNSGVESANFVPCYRKADNKPGMYDIISGSFYTNSGADEFLVGADVY